MERAAQGENAGTWRGARLTALLTLLVSLGPVSISFYTPSLPDIAARLGVDAAEVQLTMTTFLAGFAAGQLLYGPLSDRFGRRPVLLGGLVLYIAASLACAMTESILALQVGRFAQGFAACAGPVIGRAVVRDLYDGKTMARVFSIIGTAVAIAPAVGPTLGGVVQELFGWQASFLSVAAIGVLLAGVAAARLGESNRDLNLDAMRPVRLALIYGGLLGNRSFMGYVLVSACIFGGIFSYHAIGPFLYIDMIGLKPVEFGALAFVAVPCYAAGSFLSGRLVQRMAERSLMGCGFVAVLSGGALVLLLSGELTVLRVLGPMMLYSFGFGMVLPVATAGALQPFPRVAGSASAAMGAIQMSTGALASLAVAWVAAIAPAGPGGAGAAAPLGWLAMVLGASATIAYLLLVPAGGGLPQRAR